ncbi:MAG: IS21-like element helper ATPase IstB [Steroidobacteraceae bacterium]|jgi:DNA replication protein DnaC
MLIQPTLDTLNRLKLHGMALALSEQMANSALQQLAFEERVALLLEREVLQRENRRLGRLLKLAQFKERDAVIEDVDFRSRAGLDRAQLASLSSCEWIRSNQNLLIHGATGSGKTYLACALAHQACRAGLSAWYARAPRLFEELNLCHADGSFRKRLAALAKINVLVIDDFAISPLGPRERNDLLELLDDRVGSRATIVTSQLPIEHWHEYLNDPTLADAILDRLVHRAHQIHLQEKESIRKRYAAEVRKTTTATAR